MNQLTQQTITIQLSDPWELGEALAWKPLRGRVLRIDPEAHPNSLMLKVECPIVFKGESCEHFVAKPRYLGAELVSLLEGKRVLCGLTWVPDERLEAEDPLDLSWWRGGVAAIGTLSLGG